MIEQAMTARGCNSFPKSYLGDGVYAGFDGYQIWLFTEREQDVAQRIVHEIALEPACISSLKEYIDLLKRRHLT